MESDLDFDNYDNWTKEQKTEYLENLKQPISNEDCINLAKMCSKELANISRILDELFERCKANVKPVPLT